LSIGLFKKIKLFFKKLLTFCSICAKIGTNTNREVFTLKTTTADRLKQIMHERNIKQVDILELCQPYCKKYNEKLGKSLLSQYISGSVVPGQNKLTILGLALNVNEVWLMGYDVPKARVDNTIDTQVDLNLSLNERKHITKYRALDEYGKQAVDSLVNIEYDRCTAVQEEPEYENRFIIRHSFYKASAGTGVYLPDDDNDWDEIEVPDTPEARKADYALTIQGDSMEPVYFDGDIVLVKQCETIDLGQIGIFVVDGEGYIKKFGGDRLISLNDKYNDIELGEYTECRCMGRVIGRISR